MTTESLRAFAARKGNAVSYWHKQKEHGRLVMVNVGGKMLVDVEASEALMARTASPEKEYMKAVNVQQREAHRKPAGRPKAPKREAPDDDTTPEPPAFHEAPQDTPRGPTYAQAKTMREAYGAKLAQLEYERETGKLIKKQDVDSAMFEISRTVRDGLINCANRIAAEVSGLTAVDACAEAILKEHRALLDNMARQIRQRIPDAA